MSITDQQQLAESLRAFLLEFTDLPVAGGQFNLDGLLAETGKSMSLQITGGTPTKEYIDGTRVMLMPFTLFYRAPENKNNDYKSAMMGVLNGIGEWLDSLSEMPYFGESFKVLGLTQVQQANISEQTAKTVTYQAGYTLEYETVA